MIIIEFVKDLLLIIFYFLSSDVDENIKNLGNFDTELVVKATVKCFEAIRPGIELSSVLPVNMAARFRMGATLAEICSVSPIFKLLKSFQLLSF